MLLKDLKWTGPKHYHKVIISIYLTSIKQGTVFITCKYRSNVHVAKSDIES